MLLIQNANIPDFYSGTFRTVDILIENSLISKISEKPLKVNRDLLDDTVDASGLITSPGFIDIHSHGDLSFLIKKKEHPKLNQGVMSEIIGNCGLSVYPVSDDASPDFFNRYSSIWGSSDIPIKWKNTKQYLEQAKSSSTALIPLVGYSALRFLISGFSSKILTRSQINKIKNILNREIEGGAAGISFGMGYSPNIFASFDEYREMLKTCSSHDKIAAFHIRNEEENLVESINEIFQYNKDIGCRIHISHLKACGEKNWNLTDKVLEIIDDYSVYNDITYDLYPYSAGSTTISALLPPEFLALNDSDLNEELKKPETLLSLKRSYETGVTGWENHLNSVGPENIIINGLKSERYKSFEGKSLSEISDTSGMLVHELISDIIILEKNTPSIIMFSMSEDNIEKLIAHKFSFIGSDGLYGLKPHPRTYGTFPRLLGRYCRERKTLTLINALEKITKNAAERFGLKNKGEIKAGYKADIVIFDEDKIIDTATYDNPFCFPAGISHLIKDGKLLTY